MTLEGNTTAGHDLVATNGRRGHRPQLSLPQAWPTLRESSGIWGSKAIEANSDSFWSLWSRDHKPSPILKLNAGTMNKEKGFLCYIRVLSGGQFSNLCLVLDVCKTTERQRGFTGDNIVSEDNSKAKEMCWHDGLSPPHALHSLPIGAESSVMVKRQMV